ncbi:hypothetical protein [Halosimplex halobium]|uniref:hypothetical protein n=1 Tax=Halosimplex halobium TaxID=3396618 RepID=UPI003F562B00
MSEPYSLRTLVRPEIRREAAITFGILGLAAIAAGLATASGNVVSLGLALVGIAGGTYGLGELDDKAREIESEA